MDDTVQEIRRKIPGRHATDDATAARIYNDQVLSGRLRQAVRNFTNRGTGGVLQPSEPCTKTGRPVLDVLKEKHPPLQDVPIDGPPGSAFEPYDTVPTPLTVYITDEILETVASRLSGAAGPSGTDATDLKGWLLRFGTQQSNRFGT